MKTQTITSQLMRTLLLLFLFVSAFAYAQPPINTPSPYVVCDDDTNGIACSFLLITKDAEISTQPGIQISYHLTSTDSNNGFNAISKNTAYCTNNQTVFVRVIDPADPNNPSYTTLNLVVNPSPNFSIQNTNLCTGAPFATITAVNNGSAGNFNYAWTTPVGATNPGNVSTIDTTIAGTYNLLITDVTSSCTTSLTTSVFALSNTTPTFSFPTTFCEGSISVLPQTSDNGIVGTWSPSTLTTGQNTYTFNPYYGQCATMVTASITVLVGPTANQAPNLVVVDNPFDGFATFDLTSQNALINSGSSVEFNYFTSLNDAQNNVNPITNEFAYINTINPQTIYVTVFDAAISNCTTITSFNLEVINNPSNVYIPDANFKAKLIALGVDTSGDSEIQFNEALVTTSLNVSSSNIVDLTGIEAFTNLINLNCENNSLSYIQINLNNLVTLNCQNNPMLYITCSGGSLTNLNISNCSSLQSIYCGGNAITTLDLTGKPNLTSVFCELNQITALDVTGSPNLQYLSCRNNLISVLDLTNNVALTDLNCGVNLMTSLDVSHCVNLINFHCHTLPIYSLDVSNSPNLCNFLCIYNNNLTQLNIKNGNNNCYTQFGIHDNPNLQFVCTDDDEALYFETYFTSLGVNVNVNSYCTFNPAGNHNTITGEIKLDANNNGCDTNDLPQPFIKVNINDGTNSGATFTDANGNYKFYPPTGSFTLTPEVEHPTWFIFSPTTATIPFSNTNNNTTTQNFCIVPNGSHQDVEIAIEPITPARPGFDATYKIIYKNKGNTMVSGSLDFNYNDVLLDYISATVTPSSQNTGQLVWNYTNLVPFETRSFYVTLNVNSPVETPPVNIGTLLDFNATINPIVTDENQADNQITYTQMVIGSYDPNEITCLEGDNLPTSEIGKYLHYGITFENTGNYYAENVVVKDVIDTTKYDINSIQLLDTSHPVYTRITGNVVEFIYQNINLAAAGGNPPVGGHGDVLFKIKSLSNLVNGDVVTKSAKIYFDYNAPIETNAAQTTYQTLSNSVHQLDSSISIYPNPTNSFVTINCNSNLKSIELYDVQGRILETSIENSTSAKLDISDKQNGIYFLKINTDNGSKVEKIVKE